LPGRVAGLSKEARLGVRIRSAIEAPCKLRARTGSG
jgi:hypothetical protein